MWGAAAAAQRSHSREKSVRPAMCLVSTYQLRCWSGARQNAPPEWPVDFELADATVYPFDLAHFDLLASRFGVMFFAEPELSFANMRKALRPTGRLAFACWREPREHPWMMAPLQAVYRHAPKLPQPAPRSAWAVLVRLRSARASDIGAAGFANIAMERAIWRSTSRSGADSMPPCTAHSKSVRRTARSRASPPTSALRLPILSGKLSHRWQGAERSARWLDLAGDGACFVKLQAWAAMQAVRLRCLAGSEALVSG